MGHTEGLLTGYSEGFCMPIVACYTEMHGTKYIPKRVLFANDVYAI